MHPDKGATKRGGEVESSREFQLPILSLKYITAKMMRVFSLPTTCELQTCDLKKKNWEYKQ